MALTSSAVSASLLFSCGAQPPPLQPWHHLQQPLRHAVPCIPRPDVPVPREEAPQPLRVERQGLRQLLNASGAELQHLYEFTIYIWHYIMCVISYLYKSYISIICIHTYMIKYAVYRYHLIK